MLNDAPMTPTSSERRAPRWSTRIPVRYHVFDARSGQLELGRLEGARARDIGSKGLFLQQVELPVGTRIHFFFELPETAGGCIEAFGEVVHGRPRLDAMGHEVPGAGVRFLRLSTRDRARLDQYLNERKMIDAAYLSAHAVRVRAEARRQVTRQLFA